MSPRGGIGASGKKAFARQCPHCRRVNVMCVVAVKPVATTIKQAEFQPVYRCRWCGHETRPPMEVTE